MHTFKNKIYGGSHIYVYKDRKEKSFFRSLFIQKKTPKMYYFTLIYAVSEIINSKNLLTLRTIIKSIISFGLITFIIFLFLWIRPLRFTIFYILGEQNFCYFINNTNQNKRFAFFIIFVLAVDVRTYIPI